MAVHTWDDVKRERISEERLAEIKAQVEHDVLDMNLAAVRELIGTTQVELAKTMGSTQSEISRSERRPDHLVSTLRQYVQALGGELELIARFGDKSIRLKGV